MRHLGNIKDDVAAVTRHDNLGDRVKRWCNLVTAEMATRLLGSSYEGVTTAVVSQPNNGATLGAMATQGTEIWLGAFKIAGPIGTQGSTVSTYSLTTASVVDMPIDIMLLDQIYHMSLTQASGFQRADATVGQGAFQQKYVHRSPKDVAAFQHEALVSATVGTDDGSSDIYFAGVGMLFGNTSGNTYTNSYCNKYVAYPNPDAASRMLLHYHKAPTNLTADDQTNVYMTKYPDVFLHGVLRYTWMFLMDVENYLISRQKWEDGLYKVAQASKPRVQVAHPRGMMDAPGLRYLGG